MNLDDAKTLAISLLHQHGLTDWTFRFDNARRRFGSCRYGSKVITLSRPLVYLNEIDQVRDTILHEIAHALAPGAKHGPRWRAACLKVGAIPKRCYTEEAVRSPPRTPPRFKFGCKHCNWWVDRRRRPRGKYICRMCRQGLQIVDKLENIRKTF